MGSYVDSEILKVDALKECIVSMTPSGQGEDAIIKRSSKCVTLEDRVRCIQETPIYWTAIRPGTLEKYQKNAGVSQALRQKGNGEFKTKNFEDALESYNLSVMFGKRTDEELGLAYGNRSAVLVEMKDYEGALKDIDLARSHNCPSACFDKLETRRSKCKALILKRDRDQDDVQKKVAAEVGKRRRIREEMLKIQANPLIPSAASCVKIKHDDRIGRYLTVDRDVSPGTVLIVENPYAAVLRNGMNWETKNCHHCLKNIRRGVPCDHCVFVIYCDEACKLNALRAYHQWECRCLPRLLYYRTLDDLLVAFRIICKVGPEELFRIFMNRDPKFFDHLGSYGTEENCKYDSDAYLSVYHLQTTSKYLDARSRYLNTYQALLWTNVLDTATDFFKGIPATLASASVGAEGPSDIIKKFKNFVAAVMLRHIESVPLNASDIGEVSGPEKYSSSSFYNGELCQNEMFKKTGIANLPPCGAGIYPVFSMMTHSCDGNTIRMNDVSGGTLIVIAKRRLKAGETVFSRYGKHFLNSSKLERQSDLRERYYFDCQCAACELDWPLLENLSSEVKFCCPPCFKKVRDDGGCKELKKYQLAATNWMCGGCGKRYNETDLRAKLALNHLQSMYLAQSVYKHNDPCDAIKQLPEVIEYSQFHLCPPSREEFNAQALLTQAVRLILASAQTEY